MIQFIQKTDKRVVTAVGLTISGRPVGGTLNFVLAETPRLTSRQSLKIVRKAVDSADGARRGARLTPKHASGMHGVSV